MITKLIGKLKLVKDFRSDSGKRHELWVVLLVVILGTMAGHIGYRSLGDFARFNQKLIQQVGSIRRQQLPSYSTIRRVMMQLDWSILLEKFNEWAYELKADHQEQEWLAVDGKSLRNTIKNYDNSYQNFVVFVSLFSQESGLVLQIKSFENQQGSEIGQVQEIVRDCPFQNQVFTGDALHCQKETTQLIIQSNNHYLITVKKNQPKLYEKLETISQSQVAKSSLIEEDSSHGRQIIRQVSVFDYPEETLTTWSNIKSVIKVERSGIREGKPYHQISYYMSNLLETAEKFAQKIRGHWHIENQLHWVKDVIFLEDDSPINHFQAAINFSLLKTIAINLFRILGFVSITEGQRWLGNRLGRLGVLLE